MKSIALWAKSTNTTNMSAVGVDLIRFCSLQCFAVTNKITRPVACTLLRPKVLYGARNVNAFGSVYCRSDVCVENCASH